MANRRTSWRRAPSTQQHRRTQKNQSIPFSGIEDQALLTLFTHLLAKKVNVNAVNGAVYTGLFAGTQHSSNNDLLLTLRFATLVRGKPVPSATVHDLRGTTASRILIPFSRVTTVLGAPVDGKKGFVTDSQITKGSTGIGRQLQRFDDFANLKSDVNASVDQQTFGSLANNSREKWDQFQVNQAKFGVTTSFDESQYTTTIDRNSKDFAQRQREADRLAEEIESTPSQNVHIREERNQDTGNDMDEEARFSGVQRPQVPHQTPRPQPSPKDPTPERPRLSYAAAAAGAANVDPRQHISSKPPSAGATHTASANKTSQNKSNASASKPSSNANSRHSVQTGKPSQDQTAKHNQSASRGSHSASAKNAPPNGKVQPQTPKSGNKKGPAATNKQQQHQGKNAGTNKPSNQASSSKPASQPAGARPSAQAVNPKTSGSVTHAKTPVPSTRTATPSHSGTASQEQPQAKSSSSRTAAPAQEQPQAKSSSSKTTVPAQEQAQAKSSSPKTTTPVPVANKDKPSEEKHKTTVKERSSRDSLPQIIQVRAALAGRTSPNQSRNSPLSTPAVADTSAIGVLNLDAQTPNLGPEQIKRFEAYKTNREFQSIAANREKITDDLKKFSTRLDSKNGTLRRGQSSGSSTPGTPRAKSRAAPRNIPEIVTAEEVAEHAAKKQVTAVKEDIQKDKPRTETETKPVKEPDTKPTDKPEESAPKPRPKSKSKLNPNAQEFKFNPDAPSFTPASQKAQPQSPVPYALYNQPGGHVEYSQPIQLPPGYAMPIQAMTPMPYGPQSYVVLPTVPGPVAGTSGSAYPFVQQPPSFAPAHVGGRFPQSAGMSVSYGYPPHQVTPIMIPQGQQRMPTSPYYSTGPYVSAAPHQAHLYQQGPAPHLQGGTLPMAGRGGHGNPRRGGANRSRGKTSFQQSYPHVQTSGDRSAPKSPEGARSPGGAQR